MTDSKSDIPETMEFEELLKHPNLCMKLARSVFEKHHLPVDCKRITEGSRLLVSSADRYVLKVFSPEDGDFARTEIIFLTHLYGKLPIHTPELVASGHWGIYPYIIMEKLDGMPLSGVWNRLSAGEHRDIIEQLGIGVHALHTLPTESLARTPFQWHPFIEHQEKALLDNHRSFGLGGLWLNQLSDYLDTCRLDLHDPARLAPLHTELMLEHIFIKKSGTQWVLSGLIDFEPSMVGHIEYEFCAVGLFLTRGERDLFRAFLSSYGYPETELTDELSRRIMGLMLLHRYSNLKWFLTLLAADAQFTELRQLEQSWYGL